MATPNWYFKDAVEARNGLTKRQEKAIRHYYSELSKQVREEAKSLSRMPGREEEARKALELYYQIKNASRQLTAEINNEISSNIKEMGSITVNTNKRWLASLGISSESLDLKMSRSKDIAIRSILTGNLYQTNIPLSERVWTITDSNLKDIYSIVARGISLNQSVDEIAIQLQKYLNPSTVLGYGSGVYTKANGTTGIVKISNNIVDWKARRLARTMLQHAYQQSLVALTKDNPFVLGYIWHADGPNTCELCLDRDGQFYTAETLPLDHPNGQCDFEVVIDEKKAMSDLSEFYKNPIEYPDIQRFINSE